MLPLVSLLMPVTTTATITNDKQPEIKPENIKKWHKINWRRAKRHKHWHAFRAFGWAYLEVFKQIRVDCLNSYLNLFEFLFQYIRIFVRNSSNSCWKWFEFRIGPVVKTQSLEQPKRIKSWIMRYGMWKSVPPSAVTIRGLMLIQWEFTFVFKSSPGTSQQNAVRYGLGDSHHHHHHHYIASIPAKNGRRSDITISVHLSVYFVNDIIPNEQQVVIIWKNVSLMF